MKISTKAALLSAFVFPGVGHLFLKKYIAGIALAGPSCVALYYIVAKMVERSLQIVEKIQNGDVPLDVATISELVAKQSAGYESQSLDMATVTIIICWLIGVVDAYRTGRARDKE